MNNPTILKVLLNNLCDEARHSGYATLRLIELHRDTEADVRLQKGLESGRGSVDRLLRYVDDIRDLLSSDPPAGKAAEKFDAALCLEETVELLNLASGMGTNRIVLQPLPEPVTIRQDRQIVGQVLARVLEAALKLTPAGGIPIAIEEGAPGQGLRFSVVPPNADLATDLAEWLNADPEQITLRHGNGIGLAIAVIVAGRRLRTLGGTAEVLLNSEVGTRLSIHIPSQTDEISDPNFPPHCQYVGQSALDILVAEDNDESYALSQAFLLKDNLCRVRNGQEAVDILRTHRFDVVLMDIHMPGMDGYTAIRAIRDWETQTANTRTPIVILSSDDLETQQRSAAQSGCSGFLRKPLRNRDISDLLDHLKGVRAGRH